MDKLNAIDDFNWGYIGCLISFSAFIVNSKHLLPKLAPSSICETQQKLWKWRNTMNSLIHSLITGIGSFLNLCLIADLRIQLITACSMSSIIVTSITVGYFVYDFLDMAINNYKKRTIELLLHHALVSICFGLAMVTRQYQGYAMVSLLVEINSVFLHIRQLFIIHGVSKSELYYRIISHLNIGTFFIFRLLPLSWQVRWLAIHMEEVPFAVVILGFSTSAVILILNLGLLVQVLHKDFLKTEKKPEKTHNE